MDFLPVVPAATLPAPLQWNQGSDIAGYPSPRCPWAPALLAGPPEGGAPEGHPKKVKWVTGSQTARWSSPWPWSLGRWRGRVRCGMTWRNTLYFTQIIKRSCEITIAHWAGRLFKAKNLICWILTDKMAGFDKKGRIYSHIWCWSVGVVGARWLTKTVNFSFYVTVCLLLLFRTCKICLLPHATKLLHLVWVPLNKQNSVGPWQQLWNMNTHSFCQTYKAMHTHGFIL